MDATQSLKSLLSNCTLPASEARILLAHVLEKHYQLPRSALLSRDDMVLSPAAQEDWQSLESRRIDGEPIAYLLGKKGFHDIELIVGPGVLIPRPETELLVDVVLSEIRKLTELPKPDKQGEPCKILDLGTGSGAIALAIAKSAPNALLIATDQSEDALNIAQLNAKELGLEHQVTFVQGSWYQPLDAAMRFDVIVSNPPYIANLDPHLSQGDLRFEPSSALTDFASGLTCLEVIISQADQYLTLGGLIAVEHGFDQSEPVIQLMSSAGLTDVEVHQDLAGHDRVTTGRRPA
ncbi:peptide chain release factor N(5)-glutamine methyltransferase [Polynucleobacter antarcticus]|uniref:Release factor glutamine methyltransferase n=1 Tax=Polynucleobacter antarcticus TaxID=1743162 RepID=A0A6M9PS84_9BURK|nr:peptide chain release factor N(5)-glutamine methyltransferase [Polynucleobacter antarcticus]QKM61727.1 peptide chain release factor N(5)-glutamine methyltransferase [Polynucleobacter antarcticus]